METFPIETFPSSGPIFTTDLVEIVKILKAGGVGVYPAKNGYMLIGSAQDRLRVSQRIRNLKRKSNQNPLAIVSSVEDVLTKIKALSCDFIVEFAHRDIIWCGPDKESEGITSAKSKYEKNLLAVHGSFVASSANLSGQKTPFSVKDLSATLIAELDFIADFGAVQPRADYGIFDLNENVVLRSNHDLEEFISRCNSLRKH